LTAHPVTIFRKSAPKKQNIGIIIAADKIRRCSGICSPRGQSGNLLLQDLRPTNPEILQFGSACFRSVRLVLLILVPLRFSFSSPVRPLRCSNPASVISVSSSDRSCSEVRPWRWASPASLILVPPRWSPRSDVNPFR